MNLDTEKFEKIAANAIVIFTDGGCSGNPGPGAWAFLLLSGEKKHSRSFCVRNTTNNRMELTAVIEALKYLKYLKKKERSYSEKPLYVFTDSQYVKKGITEWIVRWEKNGWKNAKKQPVKNSDLWKILRELSLELQPKWEWIQGHSGNRYNEECDTMVRNAINSCP